MSNQLPTPGSDNNIWGTKLNTWLLGGHNTDGTHVNGLQTLTGGGPITAGMITAAQAAGYQGIFLDPRFVWDASGLVVNGVKNFIIESRMVGSIGWLGNIAYNAGGYITTSTGSPADGIQVYASNPPGNPTQGIIFKNCVIVGANSNAVVHFGGGQRRCGLVDTLVYNTLSAATTVAAGSNGTAVSTFTGTQALSVASSAAFPASGTLFVATSTGTAQITYSGTGTGVLNNCTLVSGSGTLATGGSVALATFGAITDTGLSANNSEDMIFSFTGGGGIAGAYAALGIGIAGSSGANDTWYYDLATSGGTYGIVKTSGGNHNFIGHYDRSSPATASVWNHGGGRMMFVGGEDQNGVGLAHLIDAGTAQTILLNRMVTQFSTPTTTMQVSAGALIARGSVIFNLAQTIALSGTGVLDLSDPAISASLLTVSGSAGTLVLPSAFAGTGSAPILTSWTGTTNFPGPAVVAAGRGTGLTTTQTVTWTPPAVVGTRFRVTVMIHPTVAGTSTVPVLAFTEAGNIVRSFTIPMWQGNSAAAAPSYTCAAVDSFYGTIESDTNGTATTVTLTITPTGSTFVFSAVIERLT